MAPTVGYWGIRGLVAPIHLLLSYTGTEFTQKDEVGEKWFGGAKDAFIKEGKNYVNLPYYQDGDIFITQSNAILAYLGRKNNLNGKTEAEQIAVDVVIQQCVDLRMALYPKVLFAPKDQFQDSIVEFTKAGGSLEKFIGQFDAAVKEGEFIAGAEVTTADFIVYELLKTLISAFPAKMSTFKNVQAYYKKFSSLEKVVAWEETQKGKIFLPPIANWGFQPSPPSLEITLGYWGIRGLLSPIKNILTHAGVEYTSKSYSGEDWFVEEKPGLLKENAYTNLPYFQEGDTFIPQSSAIVGVLGRRYKLLGETEAEQIAADVVVGQLVDLRTDFIKKFVFGPKETLEATKAEFLKEGGIFEKHFTVFNNGLKEGKFAAGGDNVTVADFQLYEIFRWLKFAVPKKLSAYPNIGAWYDKFSALESVVKYEKSQEGVPLVPPSANWGGSDAPPSIE